MTLRQEKLNSLLQDIVSSFIKSEISLPIITTVTRVEISPDLKSAKIFVSIFPEEKEKDIIDLLKRKSGYLRNYAKTRLRMKFLPFFNFEIDMGEKKRKRVDELLNKI